MLVDLAFLRRSGSEFTTGIVRGAAVDKVAQQGWCCSLACRIAGRSSQDLHLGAAIVWHPLLDHPANSADRETPPQSSGMS